jgi:hypothetical protein
MLPFRPTWSLAVWISGLLVVLGLGKPALAGDLTRLTRWAETRPDPPADAHPDVARGYRFTGTIFRDLAARAARRPGVVRVEKLGETLRGEPIWAFHVRRVRQDGSDPPHRALVFGGIHALEWISVEVATDLLVELIEAPPPDVEVTVVPLLNPDGRDRAEQDLLAGENRYRRGNAKGVDLNRDFAVNTEARAIWKAVIPGYYAHSDTPLSQPETRALDAFLARTCAVRCFDRAASLHAFGGYHYFPWSGRFERPPDWAEHVDIGRRMERAQGAHAYRTRQLARWGFFFRAQGSELDHLYGRYGIRSFLIELTRSGADLRRPKDSWKTYFRWYNPRSVRRHRAKGLAAVRALVRDFTPR